jgi:4-phosphopantoate--beta-alanine ligase
LQASIAYQLFLKVKPQKRLVIPKSHPRYESLIQRHLIEEGVKSGVVTLTGMIAQGRGETFDYLIGEQTTKSALLAEKAAICMLMRAKSPVISVNGNVAALCTKDVVKLADILNAKIEVNLFYWTKERQKKIAAVLKEAGAKKVYGTGKKVRVSGLESARGLVDPEGIAKADAVLVMLEDGDRTEALRRNGKKVIAIDLNPLSRTAQKADIAIVDNVVRALPNMIKFAKQGCSVTGKVCSVTFDNRKNLKESLKEITKHLSL